MKLYDEIFKSLNIKDDNLIKELTKIPRDRKLLKHKATDKDYNHQIDVLFFPNDNGYKYCLSAIDVATRLGEAEPLKKKDSKSVYNALMKIYKRKVLNLPILLNVDDGSEFKGIFKKKINDDNVVLIRKKAGRSRGQAVVEYLNLVIGKSIMLKQKTNEEVHKQEFYNWVSDLPKIIKAYNKFIINKEKEIFKKTGLTRKERQYKEYKIELEENAYDVGDMVYVQLDKPFNYKFRAGDLRYEKEPRKIKHFLFGKPYGYIVEGYPNTVYSGEMLIPYKNKKFQETEKYYEIEKIKNKRKNKKNLIEYLVKWKNYNNKDNSWILRKDLIKQAPELIEKFEKSKKPIEI